MAAKKILVIDNNSTIRRMVQNVLSREGHEVLLGVNGEQAMELAFEEAPDLLIVEDRLPDFTTSQVIEELCLENSQKPIQAIVLSGSGRETREWAEQHAGVARILEKPFASKALRQAVQQTLNGAARAEPHPAGGEEDEDEEDESVGNLPPAPARPVAPQGPMDGPADHTPGPPPPPGSQRPDGTAAAPARPPSPPSFAGAPTAENLPPAHPPTPSQPPVSGSDDARERPRPTAPPPPPRTEQPPPTEPARQSALPENRPAPPPPPPSPQIPAPGSGAAPQGAIPVTPAPQPEVNPQSATSPATEDDPVPAPAGAGISPSSAGRGVGTAGKYEIDCPTALVSGREVLVFVGQQEWTGVCNIYCEDEVVEIFFQNGEVQLISSNNPGLYALDEDVPWKEQMVSEAMEEQTISGAPIFITLNDKEVRMTTGKLSRILRDCGEEALKRALALRTTRIRFKKLPRLPDFAEQHALSYSMFQLLLVSYRSPQSWDRIQGILPSPGTIPSATNYLETLADELDFNDDELEVIQHIDGQTSCAEIISNIGKHPQITASIICSLGKLGLITPVYVPPGDEGGDWEAYGAGD